MSMFEYWAIMRATFSDNFKCRAYFYRRDIGAWKEHQALQASDGSDDDKFGKSVAIDEKKWLLEYPRRIVAIVLVKGQCMTCSRIMR